MKVVFEEASGTTPKMFGVSQSNQQILDRVAAMPPPKRAREVSKLISEYGAELSRKKETLKSLGSLIKWPVFESDAILQKNECSRLHKLQEAQSHGRILSMTDEPISKKASLTAVQHTFVVRHDWASAFEKAEGIEESEIKLPYELCAFEFRISGKTVIALICEHERIVYTAFVESDNYWYEIPEDEGWSVVQMVWNQIRSICIALDAEVATHSVVRASIKLNEKRERHGKVPLSDFHVVDLSRRQRTDLQCLGEDGSKKRLHFRRGHWRHFDTHKTWIRWCLVGNPDLGFISKHYSL